jgi:hypothetical protein
LWFGVFTRMSHDFDSGDPLWKLLDHASPVQAGPFFARNVVRRVRSSGPSMLMRWAVPFAFATLAVGFLLALQPISRPAGEFAQERGGGADYGGSPVVAVDLLPFFDAAAGLDDLLPSSDPFH